MAGERDTQNRDLTLSPDSYLYLQNIGKGGIITVCRGPSVVTMTGQDQPVRFDPQSHTYKVVSSLEQAVQNFPRANEGDYVVLENPASKDNDFPKSVNTSAVELQKGRKIVIPGPWSEALWPGQTAQVIPGHRLRSNQYLIAVIYNDKEAEANWEKGTVAISQTETTETGGATGSSGSSSTVITGGTGAGGTTPPPLPNAPARTQPFSRGLPKPASFAVGTRIVIRGSDVSFYIPCTGVEILRDEQNNFVREAVTLEQLEYCCLIDENGKREYPRGPAVVFPKPTQVFLEDNKKRRKFKPIELNTINGIHLKVTATFSGPNIEKEPNDKGEYETRQFVEGEELFVTGKTLSIYYPREELSIIEYGQGNKKHFSTAIPKGEGRYLINRQTGEITLIRGPKMLLPDPRTQILVRRILSDDECRLWYPGNEAAVLYNRELAQAMAESPSGRSGVVSEGDWRKRQKSAGYRNFIGGAESLQASAITADDAYVPEDTGDETGYSGGSISRGNRYTQPRQLMLNTKFDGVPRVEVWPGYAILVVGAQGTRRVVQGPEVVLLEYDEKLGFMELSTGKPKSTDKLYKTSYLCVQNNQVGDIVAFESSDHVRGRVKISLRVNFEGQTDEERQRWFSVDNYVKYLTDHVRSIIGGVTKKTTIADIKRNYVDVFRDAILGQKPVAAEGRSEPLRNSRPGLFFEANGMRVVEVEVLDLTLDDPKISKLLDEAQHKVVEPDIEIEAARKGLEATKTREQIAQQVAQAKYDTKKVENDLELKVVKDSIDLMLARIGCELERMGGEFNKAEAEQKRLAFVSQSELARAKAEADHKLAVDTAQQKLKLEELTAGTTAAVERFNAAKDGLYEVLVSLGRDEMAAKLAEACTIERWLSGDNIGASIGNLLSIAPSLKAMFDKAETIHQNRNGSGSNRLTTPEKLPAGR